MDSRPARRITCDAGAVAVRAGAHRRRPRLSASQQQRAHAKTGGNADALSRERHPNRAVIGRPGGKLRAARVCAYRLAGAARYPEQSCPCPRKRQPRRFCAAHLSHAQGVAALHRRAAQERLPLFYRPRLQHLSSAAGGGRPLETGTTRLGRPGRPCGASRSDAGRPPRPRSHAARLTPCAPSPRPCRGQALPPGRVRLRARARGAPLRPVRKNARAAGGKGEGEKEAAEGMKMNDPHVVALLYRVDHGESVDYGDAEPLVHDEPAFRLEVKYNQARFELKDHYATEEDAREAIDDYICVWEFEARLEKGPDSFGLEFDRAEIIDRNPTSGVTGLSAEFKATGYGSAKLTIGFRNYPSPPSDFSLLGHRDPCVQTMFDRYMNYLNYRRRVDRLTEVANFA